MEAAITADKYYAKPTDTSISTTRSVCFSIRFPTVTKVRKSRQLWNLMYVLYMQSEGNHGYVNNAFDGNSESKDENKPISDNSEVIIQVNAYGFKKK